MKLVNLYRGMLCRAEQILGVKLDNYYIILGCIPSEETKNYH